MNFAAPFGQNTDECIEVGVRVSRQHLIVKVLLHRVSVRRCIAEQFERTSKNGRLRTVERSPASFKAEGDPQALKG